MSTIRVIGREDIQKVFTVTAALRAVESAYTGKSAGTGRVWPMVFHEFDPGHADLDIKSGDLESAGVYGLKVVSWYDSNAEKALPALFGTSLLFDLATGEPKALLNAGRSQRCAPAPRPPSAQNTLRARTRKRSRSSAAASSARILPRPRSRRSRPSIPCISQTRTAPKRPPSGSPL